MSDEYDPTYPTEAPTPAPQLFAFDLDGTLVESYMDLSTKNYHAVQLLPRRREALAELLAAGHLVAIVTNQGGIAYGYNSEADFEAKIAEVLRQLQLPSSTPIKVCYHHPKASIERYAEPAGCARRKPSGAMIRELMDELGVAPTSTTYVGDRPEDEEAARDAGCCFLTERQFFEGAPIII